MVKPHELRIGNKIRGIAAGLVITVDMHFFNECYDDDTLLDWYMPIPLTEQWVYDFGLKMQNNSNEYWNHFVADNGWCISQSLHNEPAAGVREGYFYYGETYIEIEFVHELQNLFFVLCKSELNYKT